MIIESIKNMKKLFKFKLIAMSVLATVISVMITGISMYLISINSVEKVTYDFASKLVRQISLNIDDNIKQIDRVSLSIIMDNDITNILKQYSKIPESEAVDIADKYNMEKWLVQKVSVRDDINGIYLFSSNNHSFYSGQSPSLVMNYDVRKEPWYQKLIDFGGKFIIPTELPDRYIQEKDGQVISFVRTILDIDTNSKIATIIIDIKLNVIRKIFENIGVSDAQKVIIIDQSGKFIYSNIDPDITQAENNDIYKYIINSSIISQNTTGDFTEKSSKGNVFINFYTSPYTKWKIVSYVRASDLTDLAKTVKLLTAAVMIFSGLLTALVLIIIVLRMFKPLSLLNDGMRKVREGNLEVTIENNSDDEIGVLCITFNSMVVKLNELINTVYTLEEKNKDTLLKKLKADLNALQAQINPHFLYNTLESISMMAELNDDKETQQMSIALGKLFRISMNNGSTSVPVSMEIDHVKNYLLIQKIRFEDKFDIKFYIDDNILDYKIPKLILQPLVENSIYHGLEIKPGKGLIEIKGSIEENELVFYISDNGLGMSSDKLKEVQENMQTSFEDDYHSSRSIGLINVNQRIKLYYMNNSYGIEIKSIKNIGTTIRLNLPLLK